MKPSSTYAAKLLLILSIATAGVSVWKGIEWQKATEGLTRQLRAAQATELQLNQQAAALSELLPGGELPLPLTATLISLITTLNDAQLNNRVRIAPLSPMGAANGSWLSLLEMAQPIESTSLHRVTIKVRGTYREYSGLRRYIDLIQEHPVALTRLSIAGNTFELDIQAFGTI